ncbi:response regulator receiver protein (plasmid) [Nostoc carneum NIES-2107]|nr:response regulator receiver protein [Nostoc carneum NIES-2107]
MYKKPISFQGLRLVIVDDDPDTIKLLGILFELEGAEVKTATSVKQAIEIMSSFPPDILISDICLPDEDGYSLIKKVRKLDAQTGRRTPAIALSAYITDDDRRNAYVAGYQRYLHKPINLDLLAVAVADLAGISQCA